MKNHLIEFTCKRNRDKYIEILEKANQFQNDLFKISFYGLIILMGLGLLSFFSDLVRPI